MIKKKKILSLLLLCLFISILNVSEVNAGEGEEYNWGDGVESDGDSPSSPDNPDNPGSPGNPGNPGSPGNPGNNGNGQNNGFGNWLSKKVGKKLILYRYSASIRSSTSYNIKSTSLNGDIIKAGTWVGINIHEKQRVDWSIPNIESKEVRKVYTCKIKKQVCVDNFVKVKYDIINKRWITKLVTTCNDILETKIENEDHDYYDESPCKKYENVVETSRDEDAANTTFDVESLVINKVYNAAKGRVGAPVSKIQITTDDLDEKNEYKTLTIPAKLDPSESIDEGPVRTGKIIKVYIYKPDNICMNLKTGKVSYNKECTQEEEAQISPYIENNTSYWQYFSPLDMKSGTNFKLIIKNNSERKLRSGECHSIMDKYKNKYQNLIISLSGKTLKGDYCKNGSCSNLNKGNGSDWKEVSNGCYLTMIKTFDVVQKYYYEETKNNQLMFNGYNIYYRSINIDNPFPNTPTKNSLWYDWYNSTNKNPNLKDSFKEMTYSVAVSNKLADTIRAYNVNNPYPSFDKLSLAGESEFLRSIGVNSLTNDKYYKLGGGSKTCIKDKKVSIGSDCS